MRPALLLSILLAALSWPALARQDQQQTPAAQSPTTEAPPATAPPPPSQVPAQPSTPAGAQPAPATEAPPSPEKTQKESTAKKAKTSRKKKASKKKKVSRHKKAAPKKPAESAADPGPRRIVVRRGGTSETGGQLEPGVPATEADQQRQSTDQILDATGANLKRISQRKLTPDQQDMARQITFYMEQSRSANQEGDLGRAHNLAVKAQQLCDALGRQ